MEKQRLAPGEDFFFLNDTATTGIYPLALPHALPISLGGDGFIDIFYRHEAGKTYLSIDLNDDGLINNSDTVIELAGTHTLRSEEHTSELQSRQYIVCRLLLEKKTHGPLPLLSNHILV